MFKKYISFILSVILTISAAYGCGKKGPEHEPVQETEEEVLVSGVGEETAEEISVETDDYAEDPDTLGDLPVIMGDYDINDCISIEGLDEIDADGQSDVQPEYEDARLSILFRSNAVKLSDPDTWVELGDLVNADICAYIDGEYNDNYSRLSEDIRVGMGTEEKEIEEALLGMYVKQEKDLDKTYDEEDNYLGLGGKTVHYRIILYSISRPQQPDETQVMRELEKMQETADAGAEQEQLIRIWELTMQHAEINAYPEIFVRKARADYERRELRSESLEDYLNRTGMTRAEFKEYEDAYAQEHAAEKLAIALLCERYGIDEQDPVCRRYAMSDAYDPDDPDMPMRMAVANAVKEQGQGGNE